MHVNIRLRVREKSSASLTRTPSPFSVFVFQKLVSFLFSLKCIMKEKPNMILKLLFNYCSILS